ncbi:MAG TPA: hypothetical protein VEY09_17675 [Pyrinomonadaceae bacterium]|nr:hypothetical protein [Pyrinomonadaceae bacterium]
MGLHWNFASNTCSATAPPPSPEDYCFFTGGTWNWLTGSCVYGCVNNGGGQLGGGFDLPGMESPACNSPVLVDTAGDGFSLTDAAGGVRFDLNNDGLPQQLSWTAAGSDDSWLTLDRDGSGRIESGAEMFGNYTPQPDPPAGHHRNGFLALAEYDGPEKGGDSDGMIDAGDAVYASLRLWRDENHDGISGPGELRGLPASGVGTISLDYRESMRRDGHGNLFRFRAKVSGVGGARPGRWAYDVFLLSGR